LDAVPGREVGALLGAAPRAARAAVLRHSPWTGGNCRWWRRGRLPWPPTRTSPVNRRVRVRAVTSR